MQSSANGILVYLNETFNCSELNVTINGDFDECKENSSCKWNTDCLNTNGSYNCTCKNGFKSVGMDSTQRNKESCALSKESRDLPENDFCKKSNPCVENATCSNSELQAVCQCNEGFRGDPYRSCLEIKPEDTLFFDLQVQIPIDYTSTLEESKNYTNDFKQMKDNLLNLIGKFYRY